MVDTDGSAVEGLEHGAEATDRLAVAAFVLAVAAILLVGEVAHPFDAAADAGKGPERPA